MSNSRGSLHFLNPGISFHYADHQQIKVFYDITFKEATVLSIVSEISGEASGQVEGGVPTVLKGTVVGRDTSKLISNIKLPDMSTNEMFYSYQKDQINSGQVVLGIEAVDVELTKVEEFNYESDKFQKAFDLTLDPNLLEVTRAQLKKKAAERTLVKLEQVTDWVLVEGKFKIERAGNSYICTYRHPLSDYILIANADITISVRVSKDTLEEHSKGDFEQLAGGQPIPLKIYGKVLQPVDRNNNGDLKLTPLAVY